MRHLLLISLVGVSLISAILLENEGRHGGYDSSSSEEHGHGRPPRPRPPVQEQSKCPSDWLLFNRAQGTWCIKVFYGDSSHPASQNLCAAQGAVLTGFQTAEERMKVALSARTLNNQMGGGFSEVWIGADRKPNCIRQGSCAKNDVFRWTDGHTTGNDGFYFPGPEPNDYTGGQNCIRLLISIADNVQARYGYSQGDMDDDWCSKASKMYACGKKPVRN